MNKSVLILAALFAAAGNVKVTAGAFDQLSEASPAEPGKQRLYPAVVKAIYGEDNRLDYWELPEERRELADSVVSLWHDGVLTPDADKNFFSLDHQALNEAPSSYCPGLKFGDQKAGALCSGSFVGEDLVLTAGHCLIDLPEYGCAHTKIAFGYDLAKDGTTPDKIPAAEVYSCKEVLARYVDTELDSQNPKGGDYALIRLDREVHGRKPLKINMKGEIKTRTPLFLMGHPNGQPFKMAGNASVRNTDQKDGYFMADLDAFHGNSGSPVFNALTNEIEGILISGDTDFDWQQGQGCFVYHVNPQDGGRGEDIAKISLVRDLIARSLSHYGKL